MEFKQLDTYEVNSFEEMKVMSNPVRLTILNLFSDRQPRTNKQIAVELESHPANMHYHVKELARVGLLKLVDKKEVKGITEKYYLPVAKNIKLSWNKENDNKKTRIAKKQLRNAISELYLNDYWKANQRFAGTNSKNLKDIKEKIVDGAMTLHLTDEESEELVKELVALQKKWMERGKERDGTKEWKVFWTRFPSEKGEN
ncbi:winged helix-turn-helix domain-containing protein [Pseudalkalibacillus caeni]|uniref:Helix-turn-helix transcriptional regulator n=1 Tax=Exobacillus caeni TaxID=2574798 RepID=A0A5R9F1A2_9BACL|nr:helix-turn-helix domain-containing protein [Pseudalkalibacillus caeni]TLS35218.1 helix-turn-helix transcriptional regulator [Pseudalkalibacillus caeni]